MRKVPLRFDQSVALIRAFRLPRSPPDPLRTARMPLRLTRHVFRTRGEIGNRIPTGRHGWYRACALLGQDALCRARPQVSEAGVLHALARGDL